MSRPRKRRTPTTMLEQNILAGHIERYFETGDRSEQRSAVVRECLESLRAQSQHWTHRSVRLWFNNNRTHYLQTAPPPPPAPPVLQLAPLHFSLPMPPPIVYPMMPVGMRPLPPPPPLPVFWQVPPDFSRVIVEIDPETGLPKNPQQQQAHLRSIAVIPFPPPQ
jgi:hypothetical protein